jgi:hypothetical protein
MLMLPLAASLGWLGLPPPAQAQPVQYIEQGQASQHRPAFDQQALDRMLAPIALYPDALLTQILMASTYPLEVVQAARWSRAHPGLAGDDAVRAANREDWDPSVKSLTAFPQILAMMDERLEWTQDLGDAFLDQEPHVMETVQMLRQRAYAAGHLHSDNQVRVVRQDRYILVEPAQPQVIYVPYYDPQVIYGAWWWPAPPVYWRPWAGYAPRPGLHVGFHFGGGVRIAADFFFGRPDWQRRSVQVVHVNNYYYNRTVVNRGRTEPVNLIPGRWRHDPVHRHSAPYRSPQVRQQFAAQQRQAVEQRQPSEGRREEARREHRAEDRRPERRGERSPERQAITPAQAAPQRSEVRSAATPATTAPRARAEQPREYRRDNSDERRQGRGEARPDRGAGARSDAGQQRAAEVHAQQQRQRQEQAQQVQRQQQEHERRAQQQQAEQQQRHQAQRQQHQQAQQARQEARHQQREGRANGRTEGRTEGRSEGRGRGRGEGRDERRG